jgi:anti-anti-sigma factor
MQIQTHKGNGSATIVLKGRFDFQAHRAFRVACEDTLAAADVQSVEVDLDGVEYLDSSALGMLLLLRDKGKSRNKAISLANCRGSVRQVLDIANFGKIFPIR